jgi:hypothetical protein
VATQQSVSPALKIIVLKGEDAVNVVQQKTAVAPVVEVRDRNDIPVAGAMVTFAVQGGKAATFSGGMSTVSVTTNAAGQAAVSGFSPIASGTVHINVQAVFQGQTAVATITQTNVMTAAQAAQLAGASTNSGSSAAGAAGGSTGAGGGISATTIGLVAAAAGAGAVAATQLGGEEAEQAPVPGAFAGSFAGSIQHSYSDSSGVTCSFTHAATGTLTMTLQGSGATSSGTGSTITGTLTKAQTTNVGRSGVINPAASTWRGVSSMSVPVTLSR